MDGGCCAFIETCSVRTAPLANGIGITNVTFKKILTWSR